jgi:hypothetical protein
LSKKKITFPEHNLLLVEDHWKSRFEEAYKLGRQAVDSVVADHMRSVGLLGLAEYYEEIVKGIMSDD